MNLWQKIHLKLHGWYEDGNKTYVKCSLHGLTEAAVYGWDENVECKKCLKERLVS